MTSIPLLMGLMLVYLASGVHRFAWMQALAKNHRALAWMLSFVLPAAVIAPFFLFNTTTAGVVMLHLFFFWAACDLIAFIFRKIRKKPRGRYITGYVAVAIAVVYLAVGWANAHQVRQTDYKISTDKALSGPVRVAVIADAHLGTTLDGEKFEKLMQKIQAAEPDLLVITGDFVDDDSPKEDMLSACRSLGALKTTCGIYFVYGNHDNGYYRYRQFDSAALAAALSKNGVHILRDECVELLCGITIVGRQDRSFRNRKSAPELTEALDKSKFILMLDHQPNDYDAEAASGADLVISGHTHGGHIFPAGQLGLLMGANDRIYGFEQRLNTGFIVTSGVSGWAVPFKTGTFSEFLIVEIAN